MKTEDDDIVLVAPLQGPKKQREELLRGLDELRMMQIAE